MDENTNPTPDVTSAAPDQPNSLGPVTQPTPQQPAQQPATQIPQPAQTEDQQPPVTSAQNAQPPQASQSQNQPTAPLTAYANPLATAQQSTNAVIGKPEEKQKEGHGIISFVVTIIAALLITQIVNLFFFQSYRVFGSSMFPTMSDGDRLIISKIGKTTSKVTNRLYEPQRNDIIVFVSPKEEDLQLIKRVIGLPGERVVVKNGKITVFNAEKPQGFNPDAGTEHEKTLPASSGEADVVVPKGHVFVSGDNREGSNSLDSRNELGTVPEELIVGKASVRLWPLQTATFF